MEFELFDMDGWTAMVAEIFSKTNRIRKFAMYGNLVRGVGIDTLYKALFSNRGMQKLTLFHNFVGDRGARVMADSIALSYNCLCELTIHAAWIGSAGACSLANVLQNNVSVKKVDLKDNAIGDAGAVAFAYTLTRNRNITCLKLGFNKIGNKGAMSFAHSIMLNQTLHVLSLCCNEIRLFGLRTIGKALCKNASLIEVDVSFNMRCDKVYQCMESLLQRNSALKQSDDTIAAIFFGLNAVFGRDVYTNLLIVECIPYFALLDRWRKVAFLAALCAQSRTI